MKKYIIFAGIGFELVGIMMAAIYLGQIIDQSYQTKGLALVALMFIGLASWLIHVIVLLKKIEKQNPDDKEGE